MIQNDIQNQKDNRNIKIDKVGVKNISYPIIVEDRTNKTQHTIANIDIFVDLTEVLRGTHMSRFLEVLNSYHQEVLIDNLEAFLNDIKEKLGSNNAYINLSFP
ncbi:MAG: GTP cyclohydrolase, FolE2/MptA family [Candidatus Cloacimonetes bacterium]|nr:GTP cyclohydrolase, FolE2/MptA family [Candidatus Cloacimonadota bacterium]